MSEALCKCGSPAKAIEVAKDDEIVALGFLCSRCFEHALDEAAANRARFQVMLASGISRKNANDILIAEINAKPGPKPRRSEPS